MATLRQMVEALDTYVESASGLGINCIKGFPDFQRDNLQPPLSALFYAGSGSADAGRKRLGASATAAAVTLGVYARHEVELFDLAEKLQAMREARPTLTMGDGTTVRLYLGADERQEPDEDTIKEERHVVRCPVVMVYE